jgi:tetratricopeptide (TPR) repeat protein
MDGQSGVVALNLLGMHALYLQSYEKAIVWLEQANVLARARNPMVLNNLAIAIIRGRPNEGDRALQISEQTLALIPENPDALATRGEINVRLARWNDALKDLTQAIQARNENPEIHRLLEETYRAMKDEKMSDVHRRRAEELESAAGTAQG